MATTAKGWPYPLATEPVAAGASNIQALAEKFDASQPFAVHAVKVDIPVTTAGSVFSVVVTMPVGRFTAAPPNAQRVLAIVRGSSVWFPYQATDAGTTSIQIGIRTIVAPVNATIPVDVFCIQMTATSGPG